MADRDDDGHHRGVPAALGKVAGLAFGGTTAGLAFAGGAHALQEAIAGEADLFIDAGAGALGIAFGLAAGNALSERDKDNSFGTACAALAGVTAPSVIHEIRDLLAVDPARAVQTRDCPDEDDAVVIG